VEIWDFGRWLRRKRKVRAPAIRERPAMLPITAPAMAPLLTREDEGGVEDLAGMGGLVELVELDWPKSWAKGGLVNPPKGAVIVAEPLGLGNVSPVMMHNHT
jgi:hypothetical protein